MIVFWISAALVSAAAAALIIHRAARALRTGDGEDPALAVYKRGLSEIDDLADRGLILETERRSAHAEAARRLLAAADAPAAPPLAGRGGRVAIAVVAGLAPLVAIGVYLVVGSPQVPDQPFARRLAEWRKADPSTLTPEQMAAVLQLLAQQRPNDPRVFYFLARAQLAAGDGFSAVRNLQRAIDLDPNNAELWTTLAETQMAQAGGDTPSGDALKAFQRAAQIDPAGAPARYYLARARIAGGDAAGGLAAWRALDHDLPATDPRRQPLEQDIAVVERTHALPQAVQADQGQQAQGQQAQGPSAAGQQAFIRSMVASLAARLKANPDDAAGWARLIRSYAVLGDAPNHAAALAQARALFKDRPNDLRLIEAASDAPQ
ncbi:MAG: c-type cytochrome biogenesis protein CcmI [Caulobacteraceae bacterium]|nr:c-type cytochrome biogenesis protein CcmI [Caulobacteraceae bacterium]